MASSSSLGSSLSISSSIPEGFLFPFGSGSSSSSSLSVSSSTPEGFVFAFGSGSSSSGEDGDENNEASSAVTT